MDVHKLLQATEDELFVQLGTSLSEHDERGIGDITELSKKGRIWFEKNKERLVVLICSKYETLKNEDHIDAAIDIAGIIGSSFTGVPAILIAVIILKTGLKSLCKKKKWRFSFFNPKRRKKHG